MPALIVISLSSWVMVSAIVMMSLTEGHLLLILASVNNLEASHTTTDMHAEHWEEREGRRRGRER